MNTRDHYEVLGVPATATPAQIKSRYLYLSLAFERGKFSSREERQRAGEQFRTIDAAYRALMGEPSASQTAGSPVPSAKKSAQESHGPVQGRRSLPAAGRILIACFAAGSACLAVWAVLPRHAPDSAPSPAFPSPSPASPSPSPQRVEEEHAPPKVIAAEPAKPPEDSYEAVIQDPDWTAARSAEFTSKFDAMLESARKLVAKHPKMGIAYRLLTAALYFTEGRNLEQTLIAGKKAIELDPNNWIGWTNLGLVDKWLGNNADAEADFQKALQFSDRREAEPFAELGAFYLSLKRTEEGAAATDQAHRLLAAGSFDSHHGEILEFPIWDSIGQNYLALNRIDQALDAYRHAAAISDSDPKAWYGIGNAYAYKKMWADAIPPMEKATMLDAAHSMNWSGLGTALFFAGRKTDALEAFKKAVAVGPSDAGAWASLGQTYSAMGDQDASIGAYKRVTEILPALGDAWLGLGSAYQQKGSFADAIRAFRTAVRLKPTAYAAWLALAVDLERLGEKAEAATDKIAAVKTSAQAAGDRTQPLQERMQALEFLRQSLTFFQASIPRNDTAGTGYYKREKDRYSELLAQINAEAANAGLGTAPPSN